jgi:ESS family glutamate:Na+ symporter
VLQLDVIQTIAAGGLALFLGFAILKFVPVLQRYNIPAAVVGGLLVAICILIARRFDLASVSLDTSLQPALMTAFFTSIGMSASLSLLRAGSGQALLFLLVASAFAIVQSLVGIAVAVAFGEPPLLGVMMSTPALAGGPATALAFAPQFAAAGVPAAESLGIAAAMAGIVVGGLIGGPVATRVLERHRLRANVDPRGRAATPTREESTQPVQDAEESGIASEESGVYGPLKAITVMLVAMWIGGWLSSVFVSWGVTLPSYVGAMIVGALLRNVDDATGWLRLPHQTTTNIGMVCLTLFLSIALMNLKLWELAAVALPLLINLLLQALLVTIFCWSVVFRVMGRDYDAAVMTGGFTGFMLGTTANAMAVMRTLVDRYGPAPRAFLVAPIVGAFFIDFSNALIITGFLNFFR